MKKENPDLKHFLSIPWCAAHLNEPDTVRETASSRFPKPDTEDEFFSTTMHTDRTIAAFVTFYKRPPPSSSAQRRDGTTGEGGTGGRNDDGAGNLIRELKALLTLRSGVNGYAGVSHGGVVAAVLDEVIGLVFPINRVNNLIPEGAYMTAYLHTRYVRPVETPQTLLCVAEVKKVEGRKYWVTGRIEDSGGRVLAEAESLYVKLKEKL
ncbi:Acyl-coenzyme A thioesterase THEM4-like protein 1 [Colletotrichum chlorophyti]|uniref:Acyl-coenzyme A thioesterase THEM4-like protein 1 n=1 Tax=Colletotrichum chlorophyti TaxID=708187 RepID=A0A1Q8S7D2_9PEZI|nr:Acyl-coenzyme A thioesterase THEM4-like protein 1 [Colletotrichum chlorophyti]